MTRVFLILWTPLLWGGTGGVAIAAQSPADSTAPSESRAEAQDDSLIEHARKHADPKYVCPMHPQIIKNEPGTCPICGM
ncbi:hypothetical protein CCR91_15200, partial [Thiorhodovibrio winogradskyi]|nr:hypothetical protein [Thiorhodovibrio winogradskyi]